MDFNILTVVLLYLIFPHTQSLVSQVSTDHVLYKAEKALITDF